MCLNIETLYIFSCQKSKMRIDSNFVVMVTIPFDHVDDGFRGSWLIATNDNISSKASYNLRIYEPRQDISNNVVNANSQASDQPAYTRSLIRAFVSRLNIL